MSADDVRKSARDRPSSHVQARAGYEQVLALYEEERALALAESMSDVYELA